MAKMAMAKRKLKPILPSLRERKRYLAFEIVSKGKMDNLEAISDTIWESSLEFMGELGTAQAGIMFLKDKYNDKLKRGLIKVNNRHVNHLKSALMLVNNMNNQDAFIRSVGVSGILKKAEKRYLIGA